MCPLGPLGRFGPLLGQRRRRPRAARAPNASSAVAAYEATRRIVAGRNRPSALIYRSFSGAWAGLRAIREAVVKMAMDVIGGKLDRTANNLTVDVVVCEEESVRPPKAPLGHSDSPITAIQR